MRDSLASKVLQTIKTVLSQVPKILPLSACGNTRSNIIYPSSGNGKTQRVVRLTPGAFAPRMFTAGLLAGEPSFPQFWAIPRPSPSNRPAPVAPGGTLPTVQFKFGYLETVCRGFPPSARYCAVILWLRYSAARARDLQNLDRAD